MKIGIIGPNAGNTQYVMAKLLLDKKFDVVQYSDSYVINDCPIWSECKIEFPFNYESISNGFLVKESWKNVELLEKQNGWNNPDWFNRFKEIKGSFAKFQFNTGRVLLGKYRKEIFKYLRTSFSTKCLPSSYTKFVKIFNEIKKCDVVLTQGWPSMYPYLAKVPYVVTPYGTEIWDAPKRRDFMDPLKSAYTICSASALFEESFSKANLENITPYHLPLDLSTYEPLSVEENTFSFQKKIEGKYVFFMPGRIHFGFKGTDKVITAFSKIAKLYKNVVLILLNWGDDKNRAQKLIKELQVHEKIILLDYWFSEKSLNLIFNLSDVVLDQFSSGSFRLGTLTAIGRGAALSGRPIITSYFYDVNSYVDSEAMPVISANTMDEIAKSMIFCLENKDETRLFGKKIREWVIKYHGERALMNLIDILKNAAKN